MKTVKQWLEILKEPYKEQISLCLTNDILELVCASLEDAVYI
jgi:hypothetical protein